MTSVSWKAIPSGRRRGSNCSQNNFRGDRRRQKTGAALPRRQVHRHQSPPPCHHDVGLMEGDPVRKAERLKLLTEQLQRRQEEAENRSRSPPETGTPASVTTTMPS
ncbi:uncharacterized protein LOC143933210 [Lithobates pipiens]